MGTDNDKKQNKISDQRFLENIFEFLTHIENLKLEEVKEELRVEGFDPDSTIRKGMAFVEEQRKLSMERLLTQAKIQQKGVLGEITKLIPRVQITNDLLALVKKELNTLSESNTDQLAVAFRKLNDLTEEDLQSLLQNIDILRRLEKKESEQGKNNAKQV